jgi:hypothetical protein
MTDKEIMELHEKEMQRLEVIQLQLTAIMTRMNEMQLLIITSLNTEHTLTTFTGSTVDF